MGLSAQPCQMKAYRNLVSKFERTWAITDLLRSGRPETISDVQVAEVLQENQNIANTTAVSIKRSRNGEAVSATVTGEQYLHMFDAIPRLLNEREGIENMIFMQDGAPQHFY
ncbi:hypothetical protein ILUMI_23808 [Ignelater luminosus]|uniref:Uncharacterized protein n=1 Tax=Ignelater luminosus TaxID=2038154 RepID=A0A8K0CD67_IGNLU|nr:hypothetical protein ILUMI_23808 [Ignelater luminosus]